jgi:hypothetical protein
MAIPSIPKINRFIGYGLDTDGSALDLQFAADKTLTARKGPTPTFTRASTATFVGSDGLIQSAAIDAPRFDHDPVTLACKGLLIEESRTNFVLNSNLYLTSTPTNITATTIAGTSVTGSSQIRELSLTSSGLFTGVQANLTGTGTGIKTLSVFIKKPPANAAPYFTIGFASSAVQYAGIQVTMTGSTPVVSVTSTAIGGFSVVSSSVETFPNGWYRISVVVNGVPASCFATLYPSNAVWNGISDIRQTLVAAGTNLIYVFGAQVELGSSPTSYIPTTTAAVVRSADVCSITGSDFTGFWNQSAGTLVESFEASPNTNTTYASASNGNIIQNSLHLDNDTGLMRAVYYSGSSLVAALELGAIGTVGTVNTISTAYSVNDFAASRNGAAVVVDTSGAVPASLTQINIGADERSQTPTSFYSNRCIKYLRYYKKRLPNAKLQTLST